MGCFNVTCCVTKTPIVAHEKCWAILFKNGLEDSDFFGVPGTFGHILPQLQRVVAGQYDEYGGLDTLKLHYQDKRVYFVSDEAWQFGVAQAKVSSSYADYLVRVGKGGALEGLTKLMEALAETIKTQKDPDSTLKKEVEAWQAEQKANIFNRFEPEIRIIIALYEFCARNHFNMFDVSDQNHYAGQGLYFDDHRAWATLRNSRMEKLDKLYPKE